MSNTISFSSLPTPTHFCGYCNLGVGFADHRRCICEGYNYSIRDWEIAAGLRNNDGSIPSVPSPPLTPPAPVPESEPVSTPLIPVVSSNKADWTFAEKTKVTLPAGDYYIGDLCYVLGDKVYDGVFGGFDYDSGLYTETKSGLSFLVASTAYGDGLYVSNDGKEFGVDAGIIGICPVALMAKDDGGGHIYEFKKPVDCKFRGGIFTFESGYQYIRINTQGEYDDE